MNEFKNASGDIVSMSEIIQNIQKYIEKFGIRDYDYRLYIGSDSQIRKRKIFYATSIALHRVDKDIPVGKDTTGYGGIYFYKKRFTKEKLSFYQRLIDEANDSIQVVSSLIDAGIETIVSLDDIEVHLDMGFNGRSKEVMDSAIGFCKGMGFNWRTKAEGNTFAANISDKLVR